MNNRQKRLAKLAQDITATDRVARRSFVIFTGRAILTRDGSRMMGGMNEDWGHTSSFSGSGKRVRIIHTDDKPKFNAREGFTIDEVKARAIEMGIWDGRDEPSDPDAEDQCHA